MPVYSGTASAAGRSTDSTRVYRRESAVGQPFDVGRGDRSILNTVRLTEFQELLHTEFGVARGDALLTDHVIPSLGGRTGAAAIEAGVDPRDVWRALCADFDVPKVRW